MARLSCLTLVSSFLITFVAGNSNNDDINQADALNVETLNVLQSFPRLEGGADYQYDNTHGMSLREVRQTNLGCTSFGMRPTPTEVELQKIVQAVRALVEEEQNGHNLKCPTNDEFLLRFIRVSHYRVDISFNLMKKYFTAKVENPEAFIIQSPAKNLKTLQRKDFGLPLKGKDKCGRKVLHLKFGRLNPDIEDWKTLIQSIMMILETFSLEKEVQEKGVTLVLDCNHFSLNIMKWATPLKLRTVIGFFQESIPLRFEAVHFINYPFIFKVFVSILNIFTSEETKKKLIFHSNLYSLEQYVDKAILPMDMGGEMKLEEVEKWYTVVLEKENLFSEFRKMGYRR